MAHKKERQGVSWKIAKENESEKLNNWCNAQSNIQKTFTQMVLYMIDRFGEETDFTDYHVQKKLYEDIFKEQHSVTLTNKNEESPQHHKDFLPKEIKKETKDDKVNIPKDSIHVADKKEDGTEDEDDVYSGVNSRIF